MLTRPSKGGKNFDTFRLSLLATGLQVGYAFFYNRLQMHWIVPLYKRVSHVGAYSRQTYTEDVQTYQTRADVVAFTTLELLR